MRLASHGTAARQSPPRFAEELRVIPYGRTVVIAYQITEEAVVVMRVFHGGQDYEAILSSDDGNID
jgi:plasmid stabilization system protein ParE